MESEFIALDKAGEEVEWLQIFLEDIPNWSKPVPAICIHIDNQTTIGRTLNIMYNGKSRHIWRRHNTIRQLLSSEIITIDFVRSKDNITDPLTKGLTRELVENSLKRMRLKPIIWSYPERQPNLVDWRSQDLGSTEKPISKQHNEHYIKRFFHFTNDEVPPV